MFEDRTEVKDASASANDGELGGSVKSALQLPIVRVILRLIPALLLVASIAMFVTGIMKYDELQRKKDELEERAENIEYEIDELEYLLDSPVQRGSATSIPPRPSVAPSEKLSDFALEAES